MREASVGVEVAVLEFLSPLTDAEAGQVSQLVTPQSGVVSNSSFFSNNHLLKHESYINQGRLKILAYN